MSLPKKETATGQYKARELKRAMVKEELVALTGDAIDAIILNYFLFCQSRSRTVEKYLLEERQRMQDAGLVMNVEHSNGWFYKRASEVSEETMLGLSDSNIRRRLARLIERGWIAERRNPHHKWDKTLQYRADLILIESQLHKLGYHLDGWMIERVRPNDDGSNATNADWSSEDLLSEDDPDSEEISETVDRISNLEIAISDLKSPISKLEIRGSKTEARNTQNERAYQEYPYKDIHTRKTDNNKQAPSAQMSVVDENSSNSDLAPLAPTPANEDVFQSVREKLLDFIERREIKATSDEIEALLQKWPAAKLSDGELVSALIGDYELYWLDKPADETIARAAVKADASRLRWFVCAWPGFEEASDTYHERTKHRWTKAQCFWKRWKTAQPPANWLEGELAALRGATAREIAASRSREAKAFWDALTVPQKRSLDKETLEILNQEGGGEHFTQSSDEFVAKRQQLLLDEETREWLAELTVEAPAPDAASRRVAVLDESGGNFGGEQNGSYGDIQSDNHDDEEGNEGEFELPPRQLSIEVYVGPILEQIREKRVTLHGLENVRPNLLDDSEWRRVKDETVRRAYAEKIVA